MDSKSYLTPDEIAGTTSDTGVTKARRPLPKEIILAIMAGAFIGFAAQGSTMAAYNLVSDGSTYGLGRLVTGVVFTPGLMLVLLAGGELFTGNILIFVSFLDKKVRLSEMLKNWLVVYVFNFIGAMIIVIMMFYAGSFNNSSGLLGGVVIKTAYSKATMSFHAALLSGIMCNWLVCLAIWMCYAAKDVTGKILASFFIIGLFAISGFEHCVANMYYIPAGILSKTNPTWVAQSGLSAAQLGELNFSSMLTNNLLPVTLGNIIGGAVFVGAAYWVEYGKGWDSKSKKSGGKSANF